VGEAQIHIERNNVVKKEGAEEKIVRNSLLRFSAE
jgi:hypothetical protein